MCDSGMKQVALWTEDGQNLGEKVSSKLYLEQMAKEWSQLHEKTKKCLIFTTKLRQSKENHGLDYCFSPPYGCISCLWLVSCEVSDYRGKW